jgi:predicted permease
VLPRYSASFLAATSVIAVGVGLAAMVFALADPYAGRPLPYADPDRLVAISFGLGDPTVRARPEDVPSLSAWQARTDLFEDLGAFADVGWLRVQLADDVVPLRAVAMTGNLFHVLGVESEPTSDPTVMWVSNRAAATVAGGALQPGRTVSVAPDRTLRVKSILPESFVFPQADRTDPVDAIIVLPDSAVVNIDRTRGVTAIRGLNLVGRTRPGVTPEMIEAALGPNSRSVGQQLSVVPLATAMTARLRTLGRGAMWASALIILVCWTNVFNIALTRGLYRERELATRIALGAGPGRIVRLMLIEGLRVAALGTSGALAVTWMALTIAVRALPAEFATLGDPAVTTRVMVAIALAGGVAFVSWCSASILAWRLGTRHHVRHIVSRDGRAIRATRFVVIAGQLGAASVLLTAAALLGRSYLNLLGTDSGMEEQTQTFSVAHNPALPVSLRSETIQRVVMALRRAEGVQAAGASTGGLLNGRTGMRGLVIGGQFAPLQWTQVQGEFFEAAGLHFLLGGPPEPGRTGVVITESLAQQYLAGQMPVGQVLLLPGRTVPIVGVIRDVRAVGLDAMPEPAVYEVGGDWLSADATYVARVAGPSWRLADWPRILRNIDPLAVTLDAGTIAERLDRSVRDRTFATLVVGLFATASILVTAVGLAGIVAYTVEKRTRELAVRLTLGATRPSVTWLVVREGLTAATCGAAGGVITSVWLSSALESLLYGVRPADPTTLLITSVSLMAVVVAAAILPAIRAARIAPAIALRIE